MEFKPELLTVAERYRLMIGCIVPRPIAFVSTVSPEDGRPNLAPFSYFTGAGSDPMSLLFCPANLPDGTEKDTLRNAKPESEGGTGEFVVNVATERYARQVAAAAEPLEPGDSEFELTGLTAVPSAAVTPPRLEESPIAIECRTKQVVRLNPGAPGGGNIVIGLVVHVHVDDELVDERLHVDPDRLRAIGRMGGPEYCRTRDRFRMPMGRAALDLPMP